jgi:hypothetical protein
MLSELKLEADVKINFELFFKIITASINWN